MPRIAPLLTYADAIELLNDFADGHGLPTKQASLRRAIGAAYEELATAHRWSFLERNGRVIANARQVTGTCSYDHTGGASERICTLVGTTNPSWIDDAAVRLGSDGIVCDVEDGTSGGTTFTLDATLNPGQDVAAASYVLYQRYIRLPSDFRAFTGPMAQKNWRLGQLITLTEMLAFDRYFSTADQIQYYAVAEVADLHDAKALFIHPQPSATETIDFVYIRYPRVLRYTGHDSNDHVGTIAVTAGNATVTGTSTVFDSTMVGAVLRIATDANIPTGRFGTRPYAEERVITAVASTTSLTLDATVGTTRSGVKYVISDPIDVGRVAKNAFLRLAEKHLSLARPVDEKRQINQIVQEADRALLQAMGADNPTYYDPAAATPYRGLPYTISDDS